MGYSFYAKKKRQVSTFWTATHCPPMGNRFPYIRFDLTPTAHLLCGIGFRAPPDEPLPPFYKSAYFTDAPWQLLFSLHTNYSENLIFYQWLDRALWRDKEQMLPCVSLMIVFLQTKQRNHYNEIIWCCTYSW